METLSNELRFFSAAMLARLLLWLIRPNKLRRLPPSGPAADGLTAALHKLLRVHSRRTRHFHRALCLSSDNHLVLDCCACACLSHNRRSVDRGTYGRGSAFGRAVLLLLTQLTLLCCRAAHAPLACGDWRRRAAASTSASADLSDARRSSRSASARACLTWLGRRLDYDLLRFVSLLLDRFDKGIERTRLPVKQLRLAAATRCSPST